MIEARLIIDVEEALDVTQRMEAEGEDALIEILNFIGRSTQQRMSSKIRNSPRSGRVHTRYNPERIVRASAPGEPPAEDLGNLRRSIFLTGLNTLFVETGVAASYAEELEYGGPNNAPRPFAEESLEEAIAEADKQIPRILNRLLRE